MKENIDLFDFELSNEDLIKIAQLIPIKVYLDGMNN